MKYPPLILASRSPRRKLLLKQIGLSFSVRPSRVQESFFEHESPAANAKRIALEKAKEVAARTTLGIVIGADTIVVLDGHILGKPRTKKEAKKILRRLSGREHLVYTAFALVDGRSGISAVDVEKTKVKFRKLDAEEIEKYVATGSPMDKAGAYGIQDDHGAVFVEKVNGCFYNVMGFPLTRFYMALNEFVLNLKQSPVRK